MPKLLTIGETMAAFTPDASGPLRYVTGYGIRTAGAESNVAVGLAKLGIEAAWLSRLGKDEFGVFIRNQLRAEGVDCSRVVFDSATEPVLCSRKQASGRRRFFTIGKTAQPVTFVRRI